MMLKRTAKSCGSDAPMLASSLREEAQATVSNKPGHRGEREVSRKTIARGMPGYFRCTCGDYARVLYLFRTRGYGCIGHPAFPAPSVLRGANGFCKTSGASRRENAKAHLELERRHCEEQSDEAIHSSFTRRNASRSLSSGARSRDPLARNDGLKIGCLKIKSEKCDRRRRATLPVVIAQLDRAIQYSTGVSDRTEGPRRTGYPLGSRHKGNT